jgi:hypothetical protein
MSRKVLSLAYPLTDICIVVIARIDYRAEQHS